MRAYSGRFEVVVMGVSAGGVDLLMQFLPALPADFPVPIVVCLHSATGMTVDLVALLAGRTAIKVREALDKDLLQPGHVYLAPGGYHLLLERDRSISLSLDAPVRFARPSVDVLFDSAAHAFREKVLAVILTGANNDGAAGVRRIREAGGTVMVQEPGTAQVPDMPLAAIAAVPPDHRFTPDALPALLVKLCKARA
jgi:two-component system chemotaxis response regulator CheB